MGDDLSPDARESMEDIADAARRMSTTITTLLEVARTEASQLEASSCSLVDVVEDVLRNVDHDHLEVEVSVASQRVAAPSAILARALAPVVENAVRFARHRVSISSSESPTGDVIVMIDDDGPGVELPAQTIFLPGTTSSGGSGAGLGLALARRMARSIGGELDLAQPKGPTRFVLRLPRS